MIEHMADLRRSFYPALGVEVRYEDQLVGWIKSHNRANSRPIVIRIGGQWVDDDERLQGRVEHLKLGLSQLQVSFDVEKLSWGGFYDKIIATVPIYATLHHRTGANQYQAIWHFIDVKDETMWGKIHASESFMELSDQA